MIIITDAFDRTPLNDGVEDADAKRMGEALRRSGVNVTLTSLTAMGAFGVGMFVCGLIGGLIGAEEDKERIGKQISNYMSDEDLLHCMRHGQRMITKTSTLENYSSTQPILGRLLFGNDLTKETIYYLEDD